MTYKFVWGQKPILKEEKEDKDNIYYISSIIHPYHPFLDWLRDGNLI